MAPSGLIRREMLTLVLTSPRRWRCIAMLVLLAGLLTSHPAYGQQRPNVLFLFSDDQRVDTIGALGNDLIQTPHLDRLYRDGTRFDRAYCMGSIHGAVCVPSRAMLLSGKTLYHTNMQLKDQTTFPELFGDAGYVTFGTGKWHNGKSSFARSFQQGNTVLIGGMSDHSQVPLHDLQADHTWSEKYTGDGFSSTMFADAAIRFLQSHDNSRPFLCYVAFSAPHDPRMPPPPFDTMYADNPPPLPANFLPQHPFNTGQMAIRDEVLAPWPRTEPVVRQQLADYYGMVSHMDEQIGRILEVLDQRGLTENTVIVFASDHGLAMGSHGLLGKQSLYEHSMNTPLCLSGPGIPAGQAGNALVYLHDLFPTLCDYAGIPVPEDVEGLSLKPVIEREAATVRDSLFTSYAGFIRAVRDERWKLVRWPKVDRMQLFDLQNDPHELVNLANIPEHHDRVVRLTMLLADWQKQTGDQQPLIEDELIDDQIDLESVVRTADRWQPQWIVDKYFEGRQNKPDR